MAISPLPLSRPHLDKLSGLAEPVGSPSAAEIERRAQELLNEWLKFYFSGSPFTTLGSNGSTIQITHERCELLFDHAAPTTPAAKPLLHTLLADRRDGEPVSVGNNLAAVNGIWTWNTLARVAPQTPAGESPGTPGTMIAYAPAANLCRRVADQLAWLLRSAHTQDLSHKGIGNIRLLNGPRLVQSGPWFLRQVVWSADVTFHIHLNH
jgi:hypothetical protein